MSAPRNPDLRLVGGHPALDLVNTVAPRRLDGGDHVDFLPGPAQLLAWAQRVEVVDATEVTAVRQAWRAEPGAGMPSWRAAIEIREALYTALVTRLEEIAPAGGTAADLNAAALERLALHWAAAMSRSTLAAAPDGVDGKAARLVVGTTPALLISDRLAHEAVELLRHIRLGQLRGCPTAEGGCGWLFLDRSRNASRRWCAMEDCGSQSKARRLTVRRRANRATA